MGKLIIGNMMYFVLSSNVNQLGQPTQEQTKKEMVGKRKKIEATYSKTLKLYFFLIEVYC